MNNLDEIKRIDKESFFNYMKKTFFKFKELMNVEELYYYTDTSALINGILRPNEVCLWASRWSYLNDTKEILNGIEEIKNWGAPDYLIDGLSKMNEPSHIISFSLAKDSLPMWSMYGDGGTGVMIIFDTKELLKHYGGLIQPCLYSNSEYEIAVKEQLLNPSPIDSFWSSLSYSQQIYVLFIQSLYYVALRKDYHYDYEKEIRVLGIGNPFLDSKKENKYRFRKNKIVPYIEELIPKTALKGVCFGPLAEYELSKKALIEIFEKYNYYNVTITKSEIPYRG